MQKQTDRSSWDGNSLTVVLDDYEQEIVKEALRAYHRNLLLDQMELKEDLEINPDPDAENNPALHDNEEWLQRTQLLLKKVVKL